MTPAGDTAKVAVGGRYDGLLRALWAAAATGVQGPPAPAAVGVTLNVERLAFLVGPLWVGAVAFLVGPLWVGAVVLSQWGLCNYGPLI